MRPPQGNDVRRRDPDISLSLSLSLSFSFFFLPSLFFTSLFRVCVWFRQLRTSQGVILAKLHRATGNLRWMLEDPIPINLPGKRYEAAHAVHVGRSSLVMIRDQW